MMKERYRNMMEQAILSEQTKADLLEKLEQKRTARKGTRVLRAALIAACACVVLIGGAFAAEVLTDAPVITFFQNRANDSSGEFAPYLDGYDVVFPEMKNFSAEMFSSEVMDWLTIPKEERGLARYFESLENAEKFLGIELITPGKLVKESYGTWVGEVHRDTHCYVHVGDKDGQPTSAVVYAYYSYKDGVPVTVTASVTTESAGEIAFMSIEDENGNKYHYVEQYTAPSGLVAMIVKGDINYRAYFSANGVGFQFSVVSESIEVVHEILDAIEF